VRARGYLSKPRVDSSEDGLFHVATASVLCIAFLAFMLAS